MLRVLAIALFLVGCKRGADKAPPCGAVAAKFVVIAQSDIEKARSEGRADDAARRAVMDQLPAMRDALAHACTDTTWTETVRRCLVDASDHVAFETCQQQLTDVQRQALAKTAAGGSAFLP